MAWRGPRRVLVALRPSAVDSLGLAEAARRSVAEAAREAGWSFRFTEDLRGGRLPSAVETAAFRILQEALANAARHADSHRLDVVLGRRAEWLYLEVRDDGVGFAPVVDAATGRGLGLGFAR
jgi:two-component system NarL family sensor kinase